MRSRSPPVNSARRGAKPVGPVRGRDNRRDPTSQAAYCPADNGFSGTVEIEIFAEPSWTCRECAR